MEKYVRKSLFEKLEKYCHLAHPNDYIEVTEWSNGEGYDICISSLTNNSIIQVTHGEFKAVKKLIKAFDKL